VSAAERIRLAECGNGQPRQRGPNCRAREGEEQARRDALSAMFANKAATDRAAKLDQEIAEIRARLSKAPLIGSPNPLGATMALMLGAAADALTAWQQAVVAGVFELCLVGVMVIFELLGHRRREPVQLAQATDGPSPEARQHTKDGRIETAPTTAAPSRRRGGRGKLSDQHVRAYFADCVQSEPRGRADMKSLTRDIRVWASNHRVALPAMSELLDEIAAVCRERGIEIEVGADQRVYCLGIKLAAAAATAVH